MPSRRPRSPTLALLGSQRHPELRAADRRDAKHSRLFDPYRRASERDHPSEPPARVRVERGDGERREGDLRQEHVADRHEEWGRAQQHRRAKPRTASEEPSAQEVREHQRQHREGQHDEVTGQGSGTECGERGAGDPVEKDGMPPAVVVRKHAWRDGEPVLGDPLRSGHVDIRLVPPIGKVEPPGADQRDPRHADDQRPRPIAPVDVLILAHGVCSANHDSLPSCLSLCVRARVR